MINEILLLDDDKFMQKFVRNLLSTKYKVHCFSTIKDATQFLDHQMVELIITDLNLKGESGISFIEHIKNTPTIAHIPIITLSGEDSSSKKVEILNMGVEDYISKPFSPEELFVRINNILNKYRKFNIIGSSEIKSRSNSNQSSSNISIKHIYDNKSLIAKRCIDIIGSIFLITILSPIFVLTTICIYLESSGPIFYISKRIGKNFKVIPFIKFRSMRINADKMVDNLFKDNTYADSNEIESCNNFIFGDGGFSISELEYKSKKNQRHFFKLENDPRVTKVGNIIRKMSIDELPQLFNVLLGQMSLVGNRPLPLYEAENLTKDKVIGRFNTAAGITGLWQIHKSKEPFMSKEKRIFLDIKYALKRNTFMDFMLLVKTIPAMIQKEE